MREINDLPGQAHPSGDDDPRRKGLFFLCVLCASVVQLRFLG